MRTPDRKTLALVSLCIVAGLVLLLRAGSEDEALPAPATPAAQQAAAPSVAAAPPVSEPPPAPAAGTTAPEPGAATDARLALVRSDPVLMDRARQHELAPEADARWSEAVDDGEYRADDVDVAVREAFTTLELEPRYAEAGMIEGLLIRSMPEDHPFARVGFRIGDRLSRIQGVALRDPAELPALLSRLGPHFELCADEGPTGARCAEIALE